MCASINSASQSADDDQPSSGQISTQPLSHLIPIGGRTTRPDHGNSVPIKKFCVSANIQDGWGIVNLAEKMRIGRFVPSHEPVTSLLSLRQLLRGGGHGLAR